jgi:hypothetical protein
LSTRAPLALLTVALSVACSSLPPAQQVVADAASALGGADTVTAVRTLRIEGGGTFYMLGQNRLPDSDLPTYAVTNYVRTIDLVNGRTATQQTRTAQFDFAGDLVNAVHTGLDGAVAYNVSPDGSPRRAGERDVKDRRVEMRHHPLTIVRAALDPAARVTNLRADGDDDLVDVTTADADTLTLAVTRATKLPARVQSMAAHPNLGDAAITTVFENYQKVGALMLPTRLVTTIDRYPQLTLELARQEVDVDVVTLAAPDAVKAAAPPTPPAPTVTVEPVGKGIWWLAGSGAHRSVVFEFADHLTLFEAPANEARTKAVIDMARTLSPKPLTHAVVSHHHFDHSGGLRVAVAEGLTIVTHRINEPFFKTLVARPFTIEPDALAKAPKPMTLQLVDDSLTLKDAALEVQLYHLLDNHREGTNLYAYVPRGRLLVQADLYDNTWLRHRWGRNVLDNLTRRKLAIDADVPVHGAREPFVVMVKTIQAKADL